MDPLHRRHLLRGLSLGVLAVTAAPLVTGCGDQGGGAGPTPPAEDLALVASDVDRVAAPASAVPGAVASLHTLGGRLYGELAGEPGNLAISPFSVGVALGLTVNGARGDTEAEMLGVLDSPDVDTLDTGLNALTAYVKGLAGETTNAFDKPAEVVLDTANALFGQAGPAWEPPFLDRLARDFGAGLQTVDYVGATEAARAAVNSWTAERTRDKIPEILPVGSVTVDTRLVLVNALYLKAPWHVPFEKTLTQDEPFRLADGSRVDVPMMFADGQPAVAGDGFVGATLAYAGRELAMTVLLPDELAALEAQVAEGGLPELLSAVSSQPADVTMPRWTFRTEVPLKAPLAALGMPSAFTPAADFSGMTEAERLLISDVFHQVFVAVDEEGAEAAAATAVMVETTSAPPPALQVVLDRPFLFVIHDVRYGTPLFVGRVSDPRG